ncbi:MAG: response regulator [Gemmatimonadaceae bacterium]|nr:response regulator [Gemmatimonadaceae bacterium]
MSPAAHAAASSNHSSIGSAPPGDPSGSPVAAGRGDALSDATNGWRLHDELAPVIVYERGLDGSGAYVSGAMERILGHSPDEAAARGLAWWLEQVHEEDRGVVRSRIGPALPGRTREWSLDYRVRRASGEYAVVHDQGRVIEATAGHGARVVGVLTDVTRLRAMEQRLQHSQRLEIVGQLAAGVAHDFNNVLTAIGGFADVLLEEPALGLTPRDDVEQIRLLVARAAGLSRNLLGLARRREDNRMRLVDVGAHLQRLKPTLRVLAGASIDLRVDAEPVELSTAIDPGMLDQVVLNLVLNARDASRPGGRIEVAVAAELDGDEPRVRLSVRDNGSGVPAEVRARVFEPFFTTKGERRGTGLGLWLVREIVQGVGGRIALDSQPGEGTVVSIHFPAIPEPPSGDAAVPATRAPHDAPGLRVLLVDDEPAVRYVTRRLLERNGFHVDDCDSGHRAIAELEARRGEIDVVVTDFHMPGISGTDLLQRLRDLAPEVGCVVFSGVADRYAAVITEPGVMSVLAKPCETSVLVAEVNRMASGTVDRRRAA